MATTDVLAGPPSESEHRSQLRKAVTASTVGTTIEWYDLLPYGIVTGLVFGKLFFPNSDPLMGVLQAFAIYTVGFRDIGAQGCRDAALRRSGSAAHVPRPHRGAMPRAVGFGRFAADPRRR